MTQLHRIISSRNLIKTIALFSLVVILGLISVQPAGALSRLAPDPNDDTTNGRYWYVVSQTPYVSIKSMEAKAFFDDNGSHSIAVIHADICPSGSDENASAQGSGNHTRFDVFRVKADGSAGALINTVYGDKDLSGACTDKTLSIPSGSLNRIDDYEGGPKFAAIVRATHIGAWNTQNGFKLRADSGIIGMSSSNSKDSGLQSGGANTYETIRIPTITPCSVKSGSIWRSINIYDPDNGVSGIQPQKFRVRVMLNGNPLPASRYNPGPRWTGNAQDGYMPGSLSNEDYSLGVNWKAGEKYVIQLRNVYGNNTLQVGIPFDSLNFDCNKLPTGTIIDVTCNATQGQVITFTSRDADGSTQSRLRIGPNAAPNYTSAWGADGKRSITVPNGTGGMDFTTATWPIRLDVRNKLSNGNFEAGYETVDTANTEKCDVPPPDALKVIVKPIVDQPSTPYVEPTEDAAFRGRVNVDNFPQRTDWGYTEVAKYGTPREITATRSLYNATTTSLGVATRGSCTAWNSSGTCIQWNYTCSGSSVGNFSTAPTCYRHTCSTYSVINTNNSYSCRDRWYCPSPSPLAGYNYTGQSSPPDCNVWQCAYDSGTTYYYDNAADGDVEQHCQKRCNGGSGPASDLAGNPAGDYNCYKKPTFQLQCKWGDNDAVTVSVDSDGDKCVRTKAYPGITIGDDVCAQYSAKASTWSSPPPGWGSNDGGATFKQLKVWLWTVEPQDEKCVKVVGKPTVKIFGGDAAVGGTFPDVANSIPCSGGVTSNIAGWPHTPEYNAAGTQLAAFASGKTSGFATAMISADATPANAKPPRSLAFANSPTPSGTDAFGGSFGTMPCIYDYNYGKPSGLPTLGLNALNSGKREGSYQANSNSLNGSITVGKGNHVTFYVDGNLYIDGDIKYDDRGNWASIDDIPSLKIVVYGGNIYLNRTVHELNGIFVAQPKNGVGGHIYTCAPNSTPVSGNGLYTNCHEPLRVNGAFIAKQMHLDRTEGTAIFGESAEEFYYLPELWLGQWPKDNNNTQIRYDAMLSLPPIL